MGIGFVLVLYHAIFTPFILLDIVTLDSSAKGLASGGWLFLIFFKKYVYIFLIYIFYAT